MKIFDDTGKQILESEKLQKNSDVFILCNPNEIPLLQDSFGFDPSTVLECTNLDESVRYTSFDGYDFISIVHMEIAHEDFILRELNLYVSAHYLVLVMPQHESPHLAKLEREILTTAQNSGEQEFRINRLFYCVLHVLLSDFSDMLEELEDQMELLSETIAAKVDESHFGSINQLRKAAYTAKKQLRAFSYIGAQILMDENALIAKKQSRYFRNVDTRLKKLYDFSENLFDLSSELLYTYDSKLTMKTNETVNKLTVLTLFFGPLTVITGIYGMNFHYMPELSERYAYPLTLAVMALITFVLYRVLKKKKWL